MKKTITLTNQCSVEVSSEFRAILKHVIAKEYPHIASTISLNSLKKITIDDREISLSFSHNVTIAITFPPINHEKFIKEPQET